MVAPARATFGCADGGNNIEVMCEFCAQMVLATRCRLTTKSGDKPANLD